MAALTFAGLMSIWLLLVLSLVLGCLHPFNAISRHAIVPNTVPKTAIPTALATDSALYNAARFIGPALAGLLIELSHVGYTFAANSVGCMFYLVGLFMMRLELPDRKGHAHANMLGDIKEGLAYVRGHPGIGPLFLLMAVGAVWIRPLQDLLPGFADQVFQAGPAGLGLLTAAMGVGATAAAAMVAAYARTTGLTLAVLLAFLVNVLATLLFAATGYLWLAMVFGVAWGATLTMMSTGTQALVQSAVDNSIRARVMSLYTMIYRGAPFVGAMVIGWAADRIGLQLAFFFAALLCILPWMNAFARRGTMTLALEGRGNDYDQRLMAASKAWAGMGRERLVDLRERARPLARKTHDGARGLMARARRVRLPVKLPIRKPWRSSDDQK
jgi:MFS family permease